MRRAHAPQALTVQPKVFVHLCNDTTVLTSEHNATPHNNVFALRLPCAEAGEEELLLLAADSPREKFEWQARGACGACAARAARAARDACSVIRGGAGKCSQPFRPLRLCALSRCQLPPRVHKGASTLTLILTLTLTWAQESLTRYTSTVTGEPQPGHRQAALPARAGGGAHGVADSGHGAARAAG